MSDKTAIDFVASMEVLAANLTLFHRRVIQAYRPLAVELRKLLCDQPGRSLLPRVFVDPRLQTLASTERYEREPDVEKHVLAFSTGSIFVSRDLIRYELELARSGARLPLDEWLAQPFGSFHFSIRDMIKSVADKEAAHADPQPNDALRFSGQLFYGHDPSRAHEIAGIAEYVLTFVQNEELVPQPGVLLTRGNVGEPWRFSGRASGPRR